MSDPDQHTQPDRLMLGDFVEVTGWLRAGTDQWTGYVTVVSAQSALVTAHPEHGARNVARCDPAVRVLEPASAAVSACGSCHRRTPFGSMLCEEHFPQRPDVDEGAGGSAGPSPQTADADTSAA